MLSGEILCRTPLSVALLPPPSLIQLCKAMAAIASLANQPNIDDDDIYLENGLLSYENPNYHMNPQRIERNSHLYEEILSELQQQNNVSALMSAVSNSAADVMVVEGIGGGVVVDGGTVDGGGVVGDEITLLHQHPKTGSNRRDYARLDVGSMGVDLKENFISAEKRALVLDDCSPSELKTKSDQMSEKEQRHSQQQQKPQHPPPTSNNAIICDSGNKITGSTADNTNVVGAPSSLLLSPQSTQLQLANNAGGPNVDDLYAVPNKRKTGAATAAADDEVVAECVSSSDEGDEKGNHEDVEDKDAKKDLPPGWEKHEDNNGPYYWHIKSGTIQREPPLWSKVELPPKTPSSAPPPMSQAFLPSGAAATYATTPAIGSINSSYYLSKELGGRIQVSQSLSVTRSNTSSALDQEEERRRKEELTYKRRSYPMKSDTDRPIRFAVRSMGWVEIAEEDLTPERSSKAVNKCIVDLSLGRNDLLDVVGRWGDGKDLFMDLDDGALKLIDPENLTILNTQPIHTIRVWGVGRDNGRDFAYVARDRLTRIHMCHVFRCDTTARTIANTLRDICKRIMIERSLQLDANSGTNGAPGTRCATRPTDLPTENRRWIRNPAQSFPTPMEEPKKVLKAQYLGASEVSQPTGIDVLNGAIDAALSANQPDQWEHVNVAVAPSMISIYSLGADGRLIAECRVRYLSFLGIGQNVKNCAFIMHTADDKFVCHKFTCEPSSGALCKTIEAACKLRYQKCLDAHPEGRMSAESGTPNKGIIGATIKTLMNSFTLKKDKVLS